MTPLKISIAIILLLTKSYGYFASSNNNSQLNAQNITTKTTKDTNIKGANVNASELLTMIVGGDLNVESQKDTYNANQNGFNLSAGFGFGNDSSYSSSNKSQQKALNNTVGARTGNGKIASANGGFGASNGRTKVKQTVLTSVTGKEVDIQVDKNTNLKGSLLASGEYDANGNFQDNENLNLKTKTLTYQNSTNRVYDSSKSFNVGVGLGFGEKKNDDGTTSNTTSLTTANLSYNNSNTYSKSKTLATLGEGNVTINDTANSDDTTALNRDTQNISKTMVNTSYGVKVDATLDHRLLTEDGRKDIKEDVKVASKIIDTIQKIATLDDVGLKDFFSQTDQSVKQYQAYKEVLSNNPELAQKLSDENLPLEEKQAYANQFKISLEQKLGYSLANEVKTVSTDVKGQGGKDVSGFISTHVIFNKRCKMNSKIIGRKNLLYLYSMED